MSLKQQTLRGLKWSAVSQVVGQVAQLATTAVLARLLSPEDFGLMGMANVVLGFVMLFRDLGTSEAIVQRKEVSDELLSSIFWANVFVGLVAAGALALLAPVVAAFFREPKLVPMVMALSLNFVVAGGSLVHSATLHRKMAFDRVATIEVSATLFSATVGISAALLGHGVWSLVYQLLAQNLGSTLLLWLRSGWRPRWSFSQKALRSVAGFGLNLASYNVLNYWVRNADDLLIGRFVGKEALGYYRLAYRLMLYPLGNISWTIAKVMFPVFSVVQDDDTRFRRIYFRSVEAIAIVTTPMMLGLMVVARPFVLAVFGTSWEPVVLLLTILAPVGMIQSIGTTVGGIYLAKGRTDLMFRWSIAAGILVLAGFAIGLRWGVVGVTASYAVACFLLLYPNFAIPLRLIGVTVVDLVWRLWRTLLCGALMTGALLALQATLSDALSPLTTLSVLVLTGVAVYTGASLCLNRTQLVDLRGALRSRATS